MRKPTANPDDYPWEDSLIIAFRDMQWRVCQQRAFAEFDNLSTDDQIKKSKNLLDVKNLIANLRSSLHKQPPLLAKLDGNAESAAADVITRDGARLFLLEFKADESKNTTEHQKFIHVFMDHWDPANKPDETLIGVSRRGHLAIYPELCETPQTSTVTGLHMQVSARSYYDFNPRPKALPATEYPWSCAGIDAQQLFTNSAIGLSFGEMAAYLKVLTKARRQASSSQGGHPMKVVIATDTGVFWPFGDLGDFLAMANVFFNTPAHTTIFIEYHSLLQKIEQTANTHAADVKARLDTFKKKTDATATHEQNTSTGLEDVSP
ncbi:MAG: hypothetical protein GAK37_03728 [Pseudomonas sp.]|nr:MAG: hypothetical protein GAK37_03728 [Pseudomonas sp.]